MTTTQRWAQALLAEVNAAGNCSNPIRLTGETVNLATGEVRRANLTVPCKDRRAVICPACSYLYKADAFIIVGAGLRGGKGVDESVAEHPKFFVTLTAPSFGAVHSRRSASGTCKSRSSHHFCIHGLPLWCDQVHDDVDVVGSPLCVKCFDYRTSALWNAHVSQLWHRTLVNLRRSLASHHNVTERAFGQQAQLNYLKIAEVQRRGLIHIHAVFRIDGPEGPNSPPPSWITVERGMVSIAEVIRVTTISGDNDESFKWGSQFDIQELVTTSDSGRKVTAYLAKYATKTTDGTTDFARRFYTRQQIEVIGGSAHLKRFALTVWDLGAAPRLQPLRLQRHAHTLGFRSQLITKSRNYSTTFTNLRRARTDYQSAQSNVDPVEGTFLYSGRGYKDPAASKLADVMFTMHQELRREKAERFQTPG